MGLSGIYAIEHVNSGKLYIGSSQDVVGRWSGHKHHLRSNHHHSQHLQNAWNKYGEGLFVFKLLLICEPFELLRYEQHFIDRLRPEYNCYTVAGSPLGCTRSAETRTKMSMASKKRKHSQETRAKMSVAKMGNTYCKGRTPSTETRAKLSRASKGRTVSAETRAKISATLTGNSLYQETRSKIGAAKIGHSVSLETRIRISIGNMGRTISPETRAKISAAHKGKKLTPEHRAKIGATHKGMKYIKKNNKNVRQNKFSYSISGYKGVKQNGKKWASRINLNGKQHHLGTFPTPELAAQAYDDAARHHFGAFARLNFPSQTGVSLPSNNK